MRQPQNRHRASREHERKQSPSRRKGAEPPLTPAWTGLSFSCPVKPGGTGVPPGKCKSFVATAWFHHVSVRCVECVNAP